MSRERYIHQAIRLFLSSIFHSNIHDITCLYGSYDYFYVIYVCWIVFCVFIDGLK